MKAVFTLLLLLGSLLFASAQIDTNQPARLKTKIVCYEGKIGSGVSSTSINPSPEAIFSGNQVRNTVTSPGQGSEFTCTFVGRNGSKDVYHFTFTRQTKEDAPGKTTSTKDLSFDGRRAILFTDDLHTVVIESPSEEDLKQSK